MSLFYRSFRTIAVLVIPGKQPSSGFLQLCGSYLCVLAKLCATVVLFTIFSTSWKHFVFQAIISHRAITSTNVDGTVSKTTVPGYYTLFMPGYEPRVREWGPAATARLLLSLSAVESTPVLHDLDIFYSSRIWKFLDIFPWGATVGVFFLLETTLSQPACLLGPD